MPYFLWTNDLVTGNRGIDSDHRSLTSAIDEVIAAAEAGEDARSIGAKIQHLSACALAHFERETSFLVKPDNDESIAHRNDHLRLSSEIDSLKLQIESGVQKNPAEVYDFLKTWLRTHIISFDLEMVKSFPVAPDKSLP